MQPCEWHIYSFHFSVHEVEGIYAAAGHPMFWACVSGGGFVPCIVLACPKWRLYMQRGGGGGEGLFWWRTSGTLYLLACRVRDFLSESGLRCCVFRTVVSDFDVLFFKRKLCIAKECTSTVFYEEKRKLKWKQQFFVFSSSGFGCQSLQIPVPFSPSLKKQTHKSPSPSSHPSKNKLTILSLRGAYSFTVFISLLFFLSTMTCF